MNEVIFYTINCSRCGVLKEKLDKQGIVYSTVTDVNVIRGKGISHLPALEADGSLMNFSEALIWLQGSGSK